MTQPPLVASPEQSVAAVAREMTDRRVGSAVVVDAQGAPLGIITDRDLRSKVLAGGYPPASPASGVMSSPLRAVRSGDWAFDALLEMTRGGIHHLGVLDGDGRLVGVISTSDFVALDVAHPATLVKELDTAPSLARLRTAEARQPDMVRSLVGAGVPALEVVQLVAEVHDRTLKRVLQLAEETVAARGIGRAPVPYGLVVGGSEGRREQTMVTDQDNGLVHADVPPREAEDAGRYFAHLADEVARGLDEVGVPRCRGGFMAVNPIWRLSVSGWRQRFLDWMDHPTGQSLVDASVFFDWRFVAGEPGPAREVWSWVCEESPLHAPFHQALAREALTGEPPLGLFGRFRVRRRGPHRGTFDVKRFGIFPLVQGMRAYAVQLGLQVTSTPARIADAVRAGALSDTDARDLTHALDAVLQTRLRAELAATAQGMSPSAHVDPRRLDAIDRAVLREAFQVVRWFQRGLVERFRTQLS